MAIEKEALEAAQRRNTARAAAIKAGHDAATVDAVLKKIEPKRENQHTRMGLSQAFEENPELFMRTFKNIGAAPKEVFASKELRREFLQLHRTEVLNLRMSEQHIAPETQAKYHERLEIISNNKNLNNSPAAVSLLTKNPQAFDALFEKFALERNYKKQGEFKQYLRDNKDYPEMNDALKDKKTLKAFNKFLETTGSAYEQAMAKIEAKSISPEIKQKERDKVAAELISITGSTPKGLDRSKAMASRMLADPDKFIDTADLYANKRQGKDGQPMQREEFYKSIRTSPFTWDKKVDRFAKFNIAIADKINSPLSPEGKALFQEIAFKEPLVGSTKSLNNKTLDIACKAANNPELFKETLKLFQPEKQAADLQKDSKFREQFAKVHNALYEANPKMQTISEAGKKTFEQIAYKDGKINNKTVELAARAAAKPEAFEQLALTYIQGKNLYPDKKPQDKLDAFYKELGENKKMREQFSRFESKLGAGYEKQMNKVAKDNINKLNALNSKPQSELDKMTPEQQEGLKIAKQFLEGKIKEAQQQKQEKMREDLTKIAFTEKGSLRQTSTLPEAYLSNPDKFAKVIDQFKQAKEENKSIFSSYSAEKGIFSYLSGNGKLHEKQRQNVAYLTDLEPPASVSMLKANGLDVAKHGIVPIEGSKNDHKYKDRQATVAATAAFEKAMHDAGVDYNKQTPDNQKQLLNTLKDSTKEAINGKPVDVEKLTKQLKEDQSLQKTPPAQARPAMQQQGGRVM